MDACTGVSEVSTRPLPIAGEHELWTIEEALGRLRRCVGMAEGTRPSRPLLARAEVAYKNRRLREGLFGEHAELFREPAWDILLDLYIMRGKSQEVSVSGACIAANVPPSTALRWIENLHGRKLITRGADPHDNRRSLLHLTPGAIEMIERYLLAI